MTLLLTYVTLGEEIQLVSELKPNGQYVISDCNGADFIPMALRKTAGNEIYSSYSDIRVDSRPDTMNSRKTGRESEEGGRARC